MEKFSYLKSANAEYIDELFSRFLEDPESVDPSWRYFFEGLEIGTAAVPNGHAAPQAEVPPVDLSAEAKVAELISAYREFGRLLANTNPLEAPPASHPLLALSRFQLSDPDLSKTFTAGKLIGLGPAKLSDIILRLKQIYCASIGVEYADIDNPEQREWLRTRLEAGQEVLDAATKKMVLNRLTESETFERFLHARYVAQKRFSIEGAESTITMLDCMIEAGAELGAQEFVLGMAHRGRLNVLVNIFGKKPEYIFTEFEGAYKADTSMGEGDVKYHMGYSSEFVTRRKKNVHLSMGSNPSHLEFINPVVEGIARAKQSIRGDHERKQVIPILIHGDAAFAGQGVCYETLNLSLLPGYNTGGTLHIVINNQIGFTTNPQEGRSTPYATDLAKMLEAPILHVNGDDPEAVWSVAKLCIEFRQKFQKDTFIDLLCYRRHGHNEGDEPSFTQPTLYKKIKDHLTTREIYSRKLIREGLITEPEAQAFIDRSNESWTEAQKRTKAEAPKPYVSAFEGRWKSLRRPADDEIFAPVKTAISPKTLLDLAEKINRMPSDFHLHPKLTRFFEARLKAVQEGKGIDWGNGESLAYATLISEGFPIRLSGQDVGRGTFTHRHALLRDYETDQTYIPFNHIGPNLPRFEVFNSHLSETGVMGFEYGYSIADPLTLVIWEAQFGDFANGAQVIIDQFISSSESKWQRMSGLVLLLPHGFEGQGPEHSSARLERFLQLCGKNNMIVCNLSTPAQIFHALRRQMKRDFRKPLVIMSPKSLLRHPHAISNLEEFTNASFQEIIPDADAGSDVKRVIFCTGKIYYDLQAKKSEMNRTDIALVRIEQLYPWPEKQFSDILQRYPRAEVIWAQEEPRNMGAWTYVFCTWYGGLNGATRKYPQEKILYMGREVGAAPAVGSHRVHVEEQNAILEKALGAASG